MHAGRNIPIFGAFREDFRFRFFNAALLSDPEGVLQKQGPNTPDPDMLRSPANEQVAALEPVIRAKLNEAMAYAEAGLVAP